MVFLPWLEANFPHLLPRYLERYVSGAFLQGDYSDFIRKRMEGVRKRFDFQEDPRMHRHALDESQLKLFS